MCLMRWLSKKAKGLRSKRQSRQFPPLNAVAVGNTIGPLELDSVDALLMLAHGCGIASKSEADSKSKMPKIPKMHECTDCGLRFSSGQALGGHKRAHYEGITTHERKRVAESEHDSEKKSKFDEV